MNDILERNFSSQALAVKEGNSQKLCEIGKSWGKIV
jgi:hypothetical protein